MNGFRTTHVAVSTTASDEVIVNPVASTATTVSVSNQNQAITGGTVTIQAQVPGSNVFEDIKDASGAIIGVFDLSAVESFTIDQPVSHFSVTVSGFAGTGTDLKLAVTNFES